MCCSKQFNITLTFVANSPTVKRAIAKPATPRFTTHGICELVM